MPVVRVLGPVEVEVDGVPVDLGGPALRRLLTALAVDAGRVVPDDRLADAVWGAAPPAGARRALQVYVSRLRTALGPGTVEREGGGYRLLVGPGGLDVDVFVGAIEDGRSAAAAGDPAAAADRFAMALRAWRGEPFADLDGADRVAAVRSRLGELRASAEEELAAARIEAGDAAAAVADLTELVRAAPLRERRSTLLALALYRGGRQADALAVLRRLRAVLADELGVDPGRQAQELEQRLLAQDPALGPPPAPPAAPRRRLPPVRRPLTSFLGRAADLAELDAALAAHRLVTMVGPAGVGKTRLAVECAAGRADVRGFARLAQVREAAELPLVLAGVVGQPVVTGDPFDAVVRTLTDGPGLLVLDNCEHVVDAVAELALDLLDECPDLRILATSRTALHVDGERLQPVAPLPDADAMELFLDRVRAVRPGWQPGGGEEVHVRRVVAALDGLPLALELGAGRAATLGLQEIADRIDDRFALLPAVPHGSVAAHASLQAAIAWSVDLLDEPDRAQLLRLWPFEGGFSRDAACAVRPEGRTVADTEASLSTLVTWSVATADTSADRTRYLLLESIRGYCREIDPDPDATREAHARWVRELAARCIVELRAGNAGRYMPMLVGELPNLRAGLAHDLEHDPSAALHSVGCLGLFLTRCMHSSEAARLATAVLDGAPDGDPLARVRVLCALSGVRFMAGDRAATRELAPPLAEACAAVPEDDPVEFCDANYLVGVNAIMSGHAELALDVTRRAIETALRTGARGVLRPAQAVHGLAQVLAATLHGDEPAVLEMARQLRTHRRGWTAAWAHAGAAEAHLRFPGTEEGERAAIALAELAEAAAIFHAESDLPYGLAALNMATIALARVDRATDARRLLAEVRSFGDEIGVQPFTFFGTGDEWLAAQLQGIGETPVTSRLDWGRALALLRP